MKKFLFALLLMVVLPVYASHIVGGEFELLHISGNLYQLNLIYYFDELNGLQANKTQDAVIHVKIFRVVDGVVMDNIDIPFVSQTQVTYTQPACSNGQIVTSRQLYSTQISLTPERYNEPQGYYVVWERCCRNYSIQNIVSADPGSSLSGAAGQTFYLKFPAVVKNGAPFINSSPHLFPPLNDYACPARSYYVNFAGIDDDNDSLVYSLVTPFDTQDHVSYPAIGPAPYPDVRWTNPYSLANIMGGNPDLKISKDGLLTVTPGFQGLFVFAVKVEEFRNKIKIGETRRDFQMFVVNGCQPDQPPQIVGKKIDDTSFTYVNNMSVNFAGTVADGDRCVVVQVSDPDSNDPAQNFTENISIRAVALNFKKSDLGNIILPAVTSATLKNGTTKEFRICFPQCPFINVPYQIGIIAMDDACSLPMTDTLKILVNTQRPPNSNAYFLPPKITTAQLYEGSTGSWPFVAKDDDGNELVLSVITDGFVLKDVGMNYSVLNQAAGSANGTISWNAQCKKYEFAKRKNFTVKVLVDDKDACNTLHYDTAIFHLNVVLPDIIPALKIYNENRSLDFTDKDIEVNLGHIGFDLLGTDSNVSAVDTLNLSLTKASGTISPTDYTFADATGLHTVESKFSWDPTCSIFKDGSYDNQYKFQFIVTNNHCKTPKFDTAFVKVRIKDIDSNDKGFQPANVITTFPDHCNDFFAIDGFESEPNCEGQIRQVVSAPADNCSNQFESVRIYDRWGKLVFQSNDRKFRWYAQNEAAGVYYYLIKYTLKEYKSSLTVIH
jgi:hypothetical protein